MNRWHLLLSGCLFITGAAYGFSDFRGHSGNFMPTSTLTDTIPPLIECPPDDTVTLAAGECSAVYNYVVTASDNEPGWLLVQLQGLPSGAVYPLGQTVNWFAVVDAAGNVAQCSFKVILLPAASSVYCKNLVEVELDNQCFYTPQPGELVDTAATGCYEGYVVSIDKTLPLGNGPWLPPTLGYPDIGKQYAFKLTDPNSGNNCWGLIKVDDKTPPQMQCQDIDVPCVIETFTPSYLSTELGIANTVPVVTDNCYNNLNIQYTDVMHNLPCENNGNISGTVVRTWTASDGRNNVSTCIQTINRRRNLSEVQLPADLVYSCQDAPQSLSETGVPFITVGTQVYPVLPETFCEIAAFYTDSIALLCGGGIRIVRQWEVYDACLDISPNNPLTGVQNIDFRDTLGPEIECPAALTVNILGDSCTGKIVLPDFIVYENCSAIVEFEAKWQVAGTNYTAGAALLNWPGNMPNLRDTLARLDTLPVFRAGDTPVQLVATDACGNFGICNIVVTALDAGLPTAVCKSVLTVNVPVEGTINVNATQFNNGSSDNCTPVAFKVQRTDGGCNADTLWNDSAAFCCADVGDTVSVILRVYDFAVPAGPVLSSLGTGHYGACIAKVFVTTAFAPSCSAPPDTTLQCEQFDHSLASYGWPAFSCSTDSIVAVNDKSQFDSLCASGVITRSWKVFNILGDSATCSQQISADFNQYYYIRFPDDVIVLNCDSSGLYGVPEYLNLGCGTVSATYVDEIFNVVPDACYKVERTWTVINSCTYDPTLPLTNVPNPNPNAISNHSTNLVGPVVSAADATGEWTPTLVKINPTDPSPSSYSFFWSANANGYRYKQILKIIDSEDPVFLNCPADTVVFVDDSPNDSLFWNDNFYPGGVDLCEGQVNLSVDLTDLCDGAMLDVNYVVYLDIDNDGTQETQFNNINPPQPGQIVYNGASEYFDSRQVPVNQKFRWEMQQVVTGHNLKARLCWNTVQNPQNFILPLFPTGTHRIKWVVTDNCGNESVCEYYFTVQNSSAACNFGQVPVQGHVSTETNNGVNYVNVTLNYSAPAGPQSLQTTTDGNGNYNFDPGVPYQASYEIVPERNDNPQNGVTTFDLVLISKHILGLELLNSPFKMIAADANKSNSITTFDIVELRKLVLGIYNELPNNKSWRFVDANYIFPDLQNPFASTLPETQGDPFFEPGDTPQHDFTAIKIGDVNNSAFAGLTAPDDRFKGKLPVSFSDQMLEPDKIYDIRLESGLPLMGWQGTLELPEDEIIDILPDSPDAVFAVFDKGRTLTFSWFPEARPQAPGFTLKLRARRSGLLSEKLHLGSRITGAEAYTPDMEMLLPVLTPAGNQQVPSGVPVLLSAQPNPFRDKVELSFTTGSSGDVEIRVLDMQGRILYQNTEFYEKGHHKEGIDGSLWPASGVLTVHLTCAAGSVTVKLIKVR